MKGLVIDGAFVLPQAQPGISNRFRFIKVSVSINEQIWVGNVNKALGSWTEVKLDSQNRHPCCSSIS